MPQGGLLGGPQKLIGILLFCQVLWRLCLCQQPRAVHALRSDQGMPSTMAGIILVLFQTCFSGALRADLTLNRYFLLHFIIYIRALIVKIKDDDTNFFAPWLFGHQYLSADFEELKVKFYFQIFFFFSVFMLCESCPSIILNTKLYFTVGELEGGRKWWFWCGIG